MDKKKFLIYFEQEYPESRIFYLLSQLLKRTSLWLLKKEYFHDRDNEKIISKLALRAKSLHKEIEQKLSNLVEKTVAGIDNYDFYIQRCALNVLYDELRRMGGRHTFVINEKLTEEVRKLSGIQDITINKENIDTIRELPGFKNCKITGDSLIVYQEDIKDKFTQSYISSSSLYGVLKKNPSESSTEQGLSGCIGANKNSSDPEKELLIKECLESLLEEMSLRQKEILTLSFENGIQQKEIATMLSRSESIISKEIKAIYTMLRSCLDD